MLKSRLFWKVLGYFAILLLILTALTYIINAYIQQIEKNFAIATSDIRNLTAVEELRNCIVKAP